MNLEEKIFRALLDFEAKGDIYEEKEKVILGCMGNGTQIEKVKKYLNTLELEKTLKEHSLNEINDAVQRLTEKDFIRSRKISETTGRYFYELLNTQCDLDEFLEG
ncbi:hypothetical protein [Fusobacterium sp.]|uniref:hypothetical protein n=1 Tax=Fusobacterium sp. TaxID=68766 RepID=UPI00396C3FE1